MRQLFPGLIFIVSFIPCANAQRYSFGAEGHLVGFYPEYMYTGVSPMMQLGLAATRELTLRTHLVVGASYYETNIKVGDSITSRSKYLEFPLSLKTNFSILDKKFQGHFISGVGFNLLLSERKNIKYAGLWHEVNKETAGEAVNAFLGVGFDYRFNRSLYFNLAGLLKTYYFFAPVTNVNSRFTFSPIIRGGVFVWVK